MSIRDDIDQYVGHFREQNQGIAAIAHPMFRKVLYLVEIDTLSRAAFPKVSGNRKRVVQFIDTCSAWNDKDRVSAVQLKLALEENGILSGKLYDFVERRIGSWPYGQIIRPDNDLLFGEVLQQSTQAEHKYVNNSRYAELLYTYRSHLVHEFREPGRGMDLGDDLLPAPYYLGMDRPREGESSMEFVFPVHFIRMLCEDCVNGLESYLSSKGVSPYDAYEFETMWRRSR